MHVHVPTHLHAHVYAPLQLLDQVEVCDDEEGELPPWKVKYPNDLNAVGDPFDLNDYIKASSAVSHALT